MNNYQIWILIIALILPNRCAGVKKLWLPNLEWEVASNWQGGQVPESNNRIEFPLEKRHVVGLPLGTVQLAGFDLSRDGSIAFKKNGRIEINDFDKSSGRIRKWLRRGALFWADPSNWNISSKAVPHLRRVPCSSDLVIFPREDEVLSIRLPLTDVRVAAVQIAGQNSYLTNREWWDFRKRREFAGQKFSVGYSDYVNCERCPCQEHNQNAYLEEVCDIQRSRCRALICQDALQIEGHCCDFCGGRILLRYNVFLPKIERIVSVVLSQFENQVDWYVWKKSNGQTEILITEKSSYDGSVSRLAVTGLESVLKDENIIIETVEHSGEPFEDSTLSVSLGLIFGSLFLTIIFLIITLKIFGYSHTEILEGWYEFVFSVREIVIPGNGKSFNFARFENTSDGNVQLASPLAEDNKNASDNEEQLTSGGRFENPLYRSKRSGKKNKVEELDVPDVGEPVSMSVLQSNSSDG